MNIIHLFISERILHIGLTPGRYTVKKPCRNAPTSDADNGGAEPNDVGVGIFRPPRRLKPQSSPFPPAPYSLYLL